MNGYTVKAAKVFRHACWEGLKKVGVTPKTMARLTGTTALAPEQIDLLEQMRKDNRAAPPPYRASEIWTRLERRFEDWFYWEGIDEVEQQTMNGFFSSPRPEDPKLLRYACWLLYQNLKSRDKLGLLARIPGTVSPASGYAFEFEGRTISWDLLISLDSLYAMGEVNEAIFSERVIVADIGAGWGRMGYVLRMANPKAIYVVLDLPEALLVSSTYLPRKLPRQRALSYRESRSIPSFNKRSLGTWECAFLGAQDLERFEDKSLDFVVNICSFQEMTLEQVEQYFAIIDRKLRGTLYTLQLWSHKTHTWELGEVSGYDAYPFRPHWQLQYARNAAWSDLYFEAALSVP